MQALGPLNPLEMMFVLLFGGGFGLSPGPEDPQMARIAPPECLYYTSWAAAVQPDPKSPNATDQLLAEPEVKAFLALMEKRQVATMQAFVPSLGRAGVDARGQQILADLGRLLALLRGKPGALYISHLRLHGHGPPEVTGAAMLRLGEQAESVGQLLKKFQSRFPTEQVRQVEIGGHTWTRIQFDPGFPSIDWTLADGALMVGLGDGAAAELMARREANPPAWLSEMRAKLKVPRVASVTFLDLGAVLRLAGEASGSPQFEGILQVLGLDRVQTLSVLRGRDETGCVTRALLTVQGKGHGLLEWLDAGPLTADSLALVPRESVVALAGRLNLAGLFDTWLELMRKVDPREANKCSSGGSKCSGSWALIRVTTCWPRWATAGASLPVRARPNSLPAGRSRSKSANRKNFKASMTTCLPWSAQPCSRRAVRRWTPAQPAARPCTRSRWGSRASQWPLPGV